MNTSRLAIVVLTLAVLAWPGQLPAHEGHEHQVMGTVAVVDANHVEVETKEGKMVSIVLDGKTKYMREKAAATAIDVKVGQRVVVSAVEGPNGKLLARDVSLAAAVPSLPGPGVASGSGSEATTRYTCAMHPEVMLDKAGKCPKCGMALEPKR